MKNFSGKALFLDRSDINTDEIIPAKYLTEITKKAMAPHLLEDLKLEGFDPSKSIEGVSVLITKENFGCGSSREHAAWALEMNNINLVIAPNFARIFRQNMFNCGMMAVELSSEKIDEIFAKFFNEETTVNTSFKDRNFIIESQKEKISVKFSISDFDAALVEAGGWIDFADKNY